MDPSRGEGGLVRNGAKASVMIQRPPANSIVARRIGSMASTQLLKIYRKSGLSVQSKYADATKTLMHNNFCVGMLSFYTICEADRGALLVYIILRQQ